MFVQNKIGDMFEEIDLSHPVVSEEEQKNIDAVVSFYKSNVFCMCVLFFFNKDLSFNFQTESLFGH